MRRTVATLVATVAGLVILLSFKTAPTKPGPPVAIAGPVPGDSAVSSPPPPTVSNSAPPSSAVPAPSPKATSTPSPTGTKVVTGSRIPVREGGRLFGVVQVKVTLTNGKITALTAVSYPRNDSRSSEISSYAIPALHDEVLSAQGTQINAVSGATYTSDAYAQSVQAALDAAKA
jgi:uncharacterized protein with FMN-binding domain